MGPENCPAAVGTIDLHGGGAGVQPSCGQGLWLLLPVSPDLAPTTSAVCQGQAKGSRGEDGRAQTVGLRDADLDTSEERSRLPCLGVAVPERHVAENLLGERLGLVGSSGPKGWCGAGKDFSL